MFKHRPVAPVFPLVLAVLALLHPAAQAQKLSVTPAAGLWESRMKSTLNGVDVMAAMRAAQAEALKDMQDLPPAQRAQIEQMMKQAAGGADGAQQSCLTPAQAQAAADPKALLRQLAEGEDADPACRFELESVSGNTMKVRGTCRPEEGWSGVFTGSMTLHDAKRWSSRFTGQGRVQGDVMPGMAAPGGQVQMVMESSGRWLSADCGQVAPEK